MRRPPNSRGRTQTVKGYPVILRQHTFRSALTPGASVNHPPRPPSSFGIAMPLSLCILSVPSRDGTGKVRFGFIRPNCRMRIGLRPKNFLLPGSRSGFANLDCPPRCCLNPTQPQHCPRSVGMLNSIRSHTISWVAFSRRGLSSPSSWRHSRFLLILHSTSRHRICRGLIQNAFAMYPPGAHGFSPAPPPIASCSNSTARAFDSMRR